MRYLGIDYGKKRVGIAISDPGGRIAFPHTTLFRGQMSVVTTKIRMILDGERISKIIVGLPIGLGGNDTEETREVRKFADELKKTTPLPIEFENEMFTSRMAKSAGVKKERLDASAAAIILQSYLDKLK